MISLKFHGESDPQPRIAEFAKDEVSIGRVTGNDLVLPNTTVSSHHARIYRSNGSWMLADQESTNGTFLNGERVKEPAALSSGDKIAVGEFRIEVDLGPGGAPPAAAQARSKTVQSRPDWPSGRQVPQPI